MGPSWRGRNLATTVGGMRHFHYYQRAGPTFTCLPVRDGRTRWLVGRWWWCGGFQILVLLDVFRNGSSWRGRNLATYGRPVAADIPLLSTLSSFTCLPVRTVD
jgi:hypothetical protein